MAQPTHGYTRSGHPVYVHTRHYLPEIARVSPRAIRQDLAGLDSFNAKVALLLTRLVFTMWAFWVFNGIALISLPSAIQTGNPTVIVQWVSSNWIQLILLPALGVGQALAAKSADARSALQFEHTETIKADIAVALDRLDLKTDGGLKEVLNAIESLKEPPARPRRRSQG